MNRDTEDFIKDAEIEKQSQFDEIIETENKRSKRKLRILKNKVGSLELQK